MKHIILFLIRVYKKCISPCLPNLCRFYPTCSEYAYQSVNRYGVVKGVFLSVKRILKCNPFNSGGYDPVP